MLKSRKSFLFNIGIGIVALALLASCTIPNGAANNDKGGVATIQLLQPQNGQQFEDNDIMEVVSYFSDDGGARGVILEVNGVSVRNDRFFSPMFQGKMNQPWRVLQTGILTVCVYLSSSSGNLVRSECATIIVIPNSMTTTPYPTISPSPPDSTLTPTPTYVPTVTETMVIPTLGDPTITATQDANCRSGPGTAYEVKASLLAGQSAPIKGRSADSAWWVIDIPGGGQCWIWNDIVSVAGDTILVPVITPPSLPTATFTKPVPLSAPVPASPSGILNCANVTGGVTLSWSPVSHPNGISYYEWSLEGGVNKTGTTPSTQATINLINCSASYQWRVRAVDGQGNIGPWSNYLSFNVP